jgi:AhpD family alkylhydroperoxidase
MSPLADTEWESCLLEPASDPELTAYLQRELGRVPRPARYLTSCPWVVRSFAGISQYRVLAHLDIHLVDLIGLVVSQDNSCRFCFAMQRALLRMQGFPERRIRALEGDLFAAELDEKERAALDFARRFSRAHPLASARDLEPLRRAGWSEPAMREIAFSAAAMVYYNRVSTLPAIPPYDIEALPDRWWARLLAPLVAPVIRRRIRRMRRRGPPERLATEARVGPYEQLVAAFDGLPAAGVLRNVLDEAFAAPGLPRRTKALVFAVVARGLGCSISEAEAARMLAADGLAPAERDEILAHLSSPQLDATEAALLPLARDTIRYRPVQIQRRSRVLLEGIGVAPFVEFVGLTGLANAVCRLIAVTVPQADEVGGLAR